MPNIICLVRLALIWPIATALHGGRYGLALALFVLAAASDGLDGYLAKRFNWISELGKVLDPAADKLLLVIVFVESTWLGLVPWWVTAAAVARDAMIALGALIYRVWFGPLHGRPTIISKINTAAQLLYLMAVMLGAAAAFPPHYVLRALALIVLATTALSGLNYVQSFTRRAWAAAANSEGDLAQRGRDAKRPA
ncbi:MAG: CDP-alcohol phosphatidyltransferase family protein [Gammaproteobacteria bacterium]|nr:CDP-alcohol phosphatidyltransferase family protein [Gammaproteobacteria bacterium]